MKGIYYWQLLSRQLLIKTALSHLFLGVIAYGMSFSDQNTLPGVFNLYPENFMASSAIAQFSQPTASPSYQSLLILQKKTLIDEQVLPFYTSVLSFNVLHFSFYNGIRAGPSLVV